MARSKASPELSAPAIRTGTCGPPASSFPKPVLLNHPDEGTDAAQNEDGERPVQQQYAAGSGAVRKDDVKQGNEQQRADGGGLRQGEEILEGEESEPAAEQPEARKHRSFYGERQQQAVDEMIRERRLELSIEPQQVGRGVNRANSGQQVPAQSSRRSAVWRRACRDCRRVADIGAAPSKDVMSVHAAAQGRCGCGRLPFVIVVVPVAVSVRLAIGFVAVRCFIRDVVGDDSDQRHAELSQVIGSANHEATVVLDGLDDEDHAVGKSADDGRVAGCEDWRRVDQNLVVSRLGPAEEIIEARSRQQLQRIGRLRPAGEEIDPLHSGGLNTGGAHVIQILVRPQNIGQSGESPRRETGSTARACACRRRSGACVCRRLRNWRRHVR